MNVLCGRRVTCGTGDTAALKKTLTEQSAAFEALDLCHCAICNIPVKEVDYEGDYALETILFIPKKSKDPGAKGLTRWRLVQPRVVCLECSADYSARYSMKFVKYEAQSLMSAYEKFGLECENADGSEPEPPTPAEKQKRPRRRANQKRSVASSRSAVTRQASPPPVSASDPSDEETRERTNITPAYTAPLQDARAVMERRSEPTPPLGEAWRTRTPDGSLAADLDADPAAVLNITSPSIDGFLVVTQLVKTSAADKAGLRVGDIFLKFGNITRESFPGLKSVANLVKQSANKTIPCIILRRVETEDFGGCPPTKGSVLQKLKVEIIPLQSYDDYGGVLGAVLNTWPLPQIRGADSSE